MFNIFTGSGVGSSILYISISIFLGLILGKIKIAKISLGITWVLFVGIVISALGVTLNYDMLHVVRELGLILFVTAVASVEFVQVIALHDLTVDVEDTHHVYYFFFIFEDFLDADSRTNYAVDAEVLGVDVAVVVVISPCYNALSMMEA